jgi:hypothetical protein
MNRPERSIFVRMLAALIGVVLFFWIAAALITYYSDVYSYEVVDVAAILFGASSLALVVFSSFMAILAIVGWQAAKDMIRERVDAATEAKLEDLKNEIRGRTLTSLGYLVGEMSLEANTLKVQDPVRLHEATELCQEGYNFLKKVPGGAGFMALNNLLYYLGLFGDESRRGFLIDQARQLKAAAEEHNAKNLLLTACGVIVRYGEPTEIEEAKKIISAVALDNRSSLKERREANFYLASLEKAVEPSISDAGD